MKGETFNSSYLGIRQDLIKHINGRNFNILEVGCATGKNGKYLKENNIAKRMVGIELDENMAKVATSGYDKLLIGDAELILKDNQLEKEVFDVILLGDVLEHLKDPWLFLKHLELLLSGKGKVLISIPNIQHIETFIQVYIKGKWPYNERGIFDQTHLRFFTLKNIYYLVSQANLKIVKVERNFRYRDYLGSHFPWYGNIIKKLFPKLFTHQYIIVCQKEIP